MIGKTISHYKILSKLGEGGLGEVYKAEDTKLNRIVALKFLPQFFVPDNNIKNRLLYEARAASALNHPNIVTIHDIITIDELLFIVMEYVEGIPLRDAIKSGPLDIDRLLSISIELCQGIDTAHKNNLFHLDIKPDNIIVMKSGRVKILDFGVSQFKNVGQKSSQKEISGTTEYMCPDRHKGQNGDAQSDIFSIGIILYEMSTGNHPFHDSHQSAIIYNILNADPIPAITINPQIPEKLDKIIYTAIEKKKGQRYKKLEYLLSDLTEVQNGLINSPGIIENNLKNRIPSIAVLPLINLSNSSENEYFGEGLAEDLINGLSKINNLRVASRISSFEYNKEQKNIIKIGNNLNVSSILEGTIQKAGKKLRATVRLINITNGFLLWSEQYNCVLGDIFKIKDEITENIVKSLRLVLTNKEIDSIEHSSTTKVEAYDYYLRGRSYFHQMRHSSIESAIRMYSKAIKIDPHYALAFSGLADCYSFIHLYWDSSASIAKKAIKASSTALTLDNELAEAHVAHGLANSIIDQYNQSEKAFQKAINLNPNLFEAYYFNARIKFAQGEINIALKMYEKACQVQPDDYQSAYFLSTIYESIGRGNDAEIMFNKCINNAEKQLHINPTNARALYMGAAALVHVGNQKRGLDWAKQALKMDPNEPATFYNVACTFIVAGKIEKGLEYLQKAVKAGFARKDWMLYDSDLDPLRDHPAFISLINKLNK